MTLELWADDEQRICSACEQTNGCVLIVDNKEQVEYGRLCYLCLIQAVDAILGTKLINNVRVIAATKDITRRIPVKEIVQVGIEIRRNSDARTGCNGSESPRKGKRRRLSRQAYRDDGVGAGNGADSIDGGDK